MGKTNKLDKAYARIAIIKSIVRAERRRAEDNPTNERNIALGIIEAGQQKDQAVDQIRESFNDIELFLDHLHVAHLAAAFEAMAMPRLGQIIGESRKTIRIARKAKSPWPQDLVRNLESFSGLKDVGEILSFDSQLKTDYGSIRLCRNDLGHGSDVNEIPTISSEETYAVLKEILSLLA